MKATRSSPTYKFPPLTEFGNSWVELVVKGLGKLHVLENWAVNICQSLIRANVSLNGLKDVIVQMVIQTADVGGAIPCKILGQA
jgi:hypothetical protein